MEGTWTLSERIAANLVLQMHEWIYRWHQVKLIFSLIKLNLKKSWWWTPQAVVGLWLIGYLTIGGISWQYNWGYYSQFWIGHVNIGIIFWIMEIPNDAFILLSQILSGCSTLSHENRKWIGWYWIKMRRLLNTITYPIETTIKLVYYKSWEWEYYTQIIYLLVGLDDYLFQILLPYNEVVINLQ